MILYKKDVSEEQVKSLAMFVDMLAEQHEQQSQVSQSKYCLETLFKGLIALLDIKSARSALALSVAATNIFMRIFDKIKGPIVDKIES